MKSRPESMVIVLLMMVFMAGCGGGGGGDGSGSTGQAAVTDETGGVTFKVADQDVSFNFIDDSTGSPIPGLSVAIGMDPGQPATAILVIADGFKQYPLQIVVLEGKPQKKAKTEAPLNPTTLSITVHEPPPPIQPSPPPEADVLTGVITTLQTGILPSLLPSNPTDMSSPFLAALNALATSALFLPPPLTGVLPDVVGKERVPNDKVNEHLLKSAQEASLENLLFTLLEVSAGEVPMMVHLAEPALKTGIVTIWEAMGATDIDFTKIRFGGLLFEMPLPVFPGPPKDPNPFPKDPNLHVSATDPAGRPLSGGSLQLLCKKTIGLGIVAVLDTGGKADIPVPPCDYTGDIRAKGFEPAQVDVTVPSNGGISINKIAQPKAIAKITLTAAGLTGFLDPGTQVKFKAVATDAKGNVVSCNPVFIVSNPVGSNVATIDDTGLLTVGPDDGAVKVTARCGGITSNAILVSGKGGKEPLPPPPPPPSPPTGGVLTGTWKGNYTIKTVGGLTGCTETESGSVTFSLNQSGSTVTGTLLTSSVTLSPPDPFCPPNIFGPNDGFLNGTVSADGSKLNISAFAISGVGYPPFTANIIGNALSGNFAKTSSLGTNINGNFSVTKQ